MKYSILKRIRSYKFLTGPGIVEVIPDKRGLYRHFQTRGLPSFENVDTLGQGV